MSELKLRLRRVSVCALLLVVSGCQFLQNEFSALNVVPPSVKALREPSPQPW